MSDCCTPQQRCAAQMSACLLQQCARGVALLLTALMTVSADGQDPEEQSNFRPSGHAQGMETSLDGLEPWHCSALFLCQSSCCFPACDACGSAMSEHLGSRRSPALADIRVCPHRQSWQSCGESCWSQAPAEEAGPAREKVMLWQCMGCDAAALLEENKGGLCDGQGAEVTVACRV